MKHVIKMMVCLLMVSMIGKPLWVAAEEAGLDGRCQVFS